MPRPLVLVCDADREVRSCVKSYLSGENYEVVVFESLADTEKYMEHSEVDLIITETQLPDGDGYEFCRRLRMHSNVPLVFLSRRNEEVDRVLGLKIGADDFMGKPFSLRELSARVETVLRRYLPVRQEKHIEVEELSIHPDAYSVFVSGRRVELIPSDFKLLHYLSVNAGKVMSRERLLDAVWGMDSTGSHRSIDTQIKRIRKAVCLPDVHFTIKSIYGVGYKLEVLS